VCVCVCVCVCARACVRACVRVCASARACMCGVLLPSFVFASRVPAVVVHTHTHTHTHAQALALCHTCTSRTSHASHIKSQVWDLIDPANRIKRDMAQQDPGLSSMLTSGNAFARCDRQLCDRQLCDRQAGRHGGRWTHAHAPRIQPLPQQLSTTH
jgi:hypothetical protein